MTKNQQRFMAWVYGLVAAIIGGATTAVGAAVIAPGSFNIQDTDGIAHLFQIMGFSGILHGVGYLKQSPLPQLEFGDEVVTTTTATPVSTVTKTSQQ